MHSLSHSVRETHRGISWINIHIPHKHIISYFVLSLPLSVADNHWVYFSWSKTGGSLNSTHPQKPQRWSSQSKGRPRLSPFLSLSMHLVTKLDFLYTWYPHGFHGPLTAGGLHCCQKKTHRFMYISSAALIVFVFTVIVQGYISLSDSQAPKIPKI